MPMIDVDPRELDDEFIVHIFMTKSDFDNKEFIGLAKVPYKESFEKPMETVIFKNAKIKDPDGDSDMCPLDG